MRPLYVLTLLFAAALAAPAYYLVEPVQTFPTSPGAYHTASLVSGAASRVDSAPVGQPAVAPVVNVDTQYHAQDELGQYSYGYAGSDGSAKAEIRTQDGTVAGKYSYVGPIGEQIELKYIADKGGFRAQGAHLPEAPQAAGAPTQTYLVAESQLHATQVKHSVDDRDDGKDDGPDDDRDDGKDDGPDDDRDDGKDDGPDGDRDDGPDGDRDDGKDDGPDGDRDDGKDDGPDGDRDDGKDDGHDGDRDDGKDDGHDGDRDDGKDGPDGDRDDGKDDGPDGDRDDGKDDGHDNDKDDGKHDGHDGHDSDRDDGHDSGRDDERDDGKDDRDGKDRDSGAEKPDEIDGQDDDDDRKAVGGGVQYFLAQPIQQSSAGQVQQPSTVAQQPAPVAKAADVDPILAYVAVDSKANQVQQPASSYGTFSSAVQQPAPVARTPEVSPVLAYVAVESKAPAVVATAAPAPAPAPAQFPAHHVQKHGAKSANDYRFVSLW